MQHCEKSEQLYDHYKETCGLNRNACKERNKFFILLVVGILVLLLLSVRPGFAADLAIAILKGRVDIDITPSIRLLQAGTWMFVLYSLMRYIQANIKIEKDYLYIADLEKKLAQCGIDVSRDGKSYIEEYPKVQDFISVIYSALCPTIYIVCFSYKIYLEWVNSLPQISPVLIFDSVLAAICIVLVLFYLIFRYNIYKQYKIRKKNGPRSKKI